MIRLARVSGMLFIEAGRTCEPSVSQVFTAERRQYTYTREALRDLARAVRKSSNPARNGRENAPVSASCPNWLRLR